MVCGARGTNVAAAVVCAVLASMPHGVAAAGKGCDGEFQCSGFIENSDLMVYGAGGGSLTCRYGHIEDGGTCEEPCEGTRTAMCRCKTMDEAEEDVAEEAKTQMYICVGILVASSLCVSWKFKKARQRAALSEPPSGGSPYQTDGAVPGEAPVAQASVVEATVVGDNNENNAVEKNSSEASFADQRPPMKANVISRSSSRIVEVTQRNPNKVRLFSGLITIVFPVAGIVFWVVRVNESDVGIMDSFGLFMGLAAIIVYFSVLILLAAWQVARLGMPRFLELLNTNPLFCMNLVHSKLLFCVPLVCGAGAWWSINRMNNPEGIYSTC